MAKPIPDGYHTLTPALTVKNGGEAIEFYKRALGAEEIMQFPGPDGRLMHAGRKSGGSRFRLGEGMPEQGCRAPVSVGASSSSLYIYVHDVDKAFQRAVE